VYLMNIIFSVCYNLYKLGRPGAGAHTSCFHFHRSANWLLPVSAQVLIFPSLPTSLDTVASSAKHLPALPVSSL
jgi:hypothetical protein